MRTSEVHRTTRETDISLSLDIDGTGAGTIVAGIPFFDHMLTSFARHGRMDLTVRAAGDIAVDAHHTIEDIGIVLGTALAEAVGDGRGITRFADAAVPMDEALARVALDVVRQIGDFLFHLVVGGGVLRGYVAAVIGVGVEKVLSRVPRLGASVHEFHNLGHNNFLHSLVAEKPWRQPRRSCPWDTTLKLLKF